VLLTKHITTTVETDGNADMVNTVIIVMLRAVCLSKQPDDTFAVLLPQEC